MNKQAKCILVLAWIVLIVVIILTDLAHGSTHKNRSNSLGVVLTDINPNVYAFGKLTGIEVDWCAKYQPCTKVSSRPYHTELIMSEETLLCGNELESFRGKGTIVIMTYRRQASRNFDGISCHDLVSVFPVSDTKLENF